MTPMKKENHGCTRMGRMTRMRNGDGKNREEEENAEKKERDDKEAGKWGINSLVVFLLFFYPIACANFLEESLALEIGQHAAHGIVVLPQSFRRLFSRQTSLQAAEEPERRPAQLSARS